MTYYVTLMPGCPFELDLGTVISHHGGKISLSLVAPTPGLPIWQVEELKAQITDLRRELEELKARPQAKVVYEASF